MRSRPHVNQAYPDRIENCLGFEIEGGKNQRTRGRRMINKRLFFAFDFDDLDAKAECLLVTEAARASARLQQGQSCGVAGHVKATDKMSPLRWNTIVDSLCWKSAPDTISV